MFLGIVILGLLHGLCILPVYLSLLCWRPAVVRPQRDHVPNGTGQPAKDLQMEGFSESENMAYPNKKEHHNTSDIGISNKGLDNNEDKSTKCDTAAGGQTTP